MVIHAVTQAATVYSLNVFYRVLVCLSPYFAPLLWQDLHDRQQPIPLVNTHQCICIPISTQNILTTKNVGAYASHISKLNRHKLKS